MHYDQESDTPKLVSRLDNAAEQLGQSHLGASEDEVETPVRIVLSDGLPAAAGGLAAMMAAGASLLMGLGVAAISGLAFTLFHARSQP